MGIKTVTSSCAVIVLSAVLSTGWPFTAAIAASEQEVTETALPPPQTGGERTSIDVNDTNKVMKINEEELVGSQGNAENRKTNVQDFQADIRQGAVQKEPADNFAQQQVDKLAADQKAFCSKYLEKMYLRRQETCSTVPSRLCETFNPEGMTWNFTVNPYCYTLLSKRALPISTTNISRCEVTCVNSKN